MGGIKQSSSQPLLNCEYFNVFDAIKHERMTSTRHMRNACGMAWMIPPNVELFEISTIIKWTRRICENLHASSGWSAGSPSAASRFFEGSNFIARAHSAPNRAKLRNGKRWISKPRRLITANTDYDAQSPSVGEHSSTVAAGRLSDFGALASINSVCVRNVCKYLVCKPRRALCSINIHVFTIFQCLFTHIFHFFLMRILP